MIAAYLLIMLSAGGLGFVGKRFGLRASLPIALLLGILLCIALTIWIDWRLKHSLYP